MGREDIVVCSVGCLNCPQKYQRVRHEAAGTLEFPFLILLCCQAHALHLFIKEYLKEDLIGSNKKDRDRIEPCPWAWWRGMENGKVATARLAPIWQSLEEHMDAFVVK
jgi:hypothetical protein